MLKLMKVTSWIGQQNWMQYYFSDVRVGIIFHLQRTGNRIEDAIEISLLAVEVR
jgi:hypothetical protein